MDTDNERGSGRKEKTRIRKIIEAEETRRHETKRKKGRKWRRGRMSRRRRKRNKER